MKKEIILILIANRGGHVVEEKIDEIKAFGGKDSYRVSLTDGIVNIFNIDRLKKSIFDTIVSAIDAVKEAEGETEYDMKVYLLTSGSIVINILASLVIKEMGLSVNLLIWDTKNHQYVPRENL